MKNLKKFFAFSIATAMVAGAVWAGTPGVMAVAKKLIPHYYYDKNTNLYTEIPRDGYVDVWEESDGNYTYTKPLIKEPGGEITIEVQHELELELPSDYASSSNKEWGSLSPNIVSVDDSGVISGLSIGFAEVYCNISTADAVYQIIYDIIVTSSDEPSKYTIDVSIDPKEATLYVGGYANATATLESSIIKDFESVSPDMISFKSSDESVAHVSGMSKDNGKLKLEIGGYKPGTASIAIDVTDNYSRYFKVNSDEFKVTVRTESSKQNATDPNAPTSEERAKQEQTPESIANYQNWLATYGGGGAAAAPVGVTAVSGEVGQPGSEAIVNTGTGEPVAMFQSNDTTNTLLAAPVGVVPSGTKIETVEAGKDTPAFKAVQNKLSRISRRGTVQKVYGIAGLNPDGSIMTLINGKAAMSMPMPTDITVPAGKSLKVYLIDDNGQTTKLDTAIDQGRVVFEIPKFGTFAFVVE